MTASLIPRLRLWRRLHGAEGSLRRRLVSGSAWHLGATAYNSSLLLAQTLLATHCLRDAREFGLVNAVMWAYTLAEVFTTSGLGLALTQHRGEVGHLLGPVWTVQAVRGCVLGAGVAVIGTLMSVYYGEPAIAPLAWTAAISAPLNGLAGLGPLLTLRELSFRRAALFGALETTLGAAAGCVLIYSLRSAWAVAVGLNAMAVARIITSYLMRPEAPRLDFRWGRLRPFLPFAATALFAAILAFGNERGDDFVVGTVLGMDELGLYHVAFLYANLPGLKLGQVLGNLLIPAFARLRGDRARLRVALGEYLAAVMTLATVLFALLAVLAPLLFGAIGGGRFLSAVPSFRVLCLFGWLRFFQFSAEATFNALGRPGHVGRGQLVQFFVMALLVTPLTLRLRAPGAAVAVTAASVASSLYYAWALARLVLRDGSGAAPVPLQAPAVPVREEAACVN